MSKTLKGLAGLVAGAAFAIGMTGAAAAATDFSVEAMHKAGTHQFYLWCTGEEDGQTTASGANWEEARQAAYAATGKPNCVPIWQGLVQ
jgi:hypothetical protein